MSSSTTFSRFPDLPAELRLKIWDEALNGPSMHVFDVCFPSWRGAERSKRAFQDSTGNISEESQKRWSKYSQCVFLDAVESGSAELSRSTRVARHAHDPSVYKLRRARRLTSAEASAASAGRMMGGTNTVYLPGRNERVVYNNDEDVLFLRFRDGGALTELSQGVLFGEYEASGANNLSEVLEGPWSAEMATTLHGAGKIALDVAETWTPATVGAVLLEEVAYLGCCLQQGLRVLYLVDHCPGRCARCNRTDKKASRLQSSGALYKQLHGDEVAERAPDVIRGVGKTYREVFDLEGLGWSDSHPSYVFARAMNETIRSQQADADAKNFQGVRVLVVEDDKVDGLDTTTLMDCNPEDAPEKMMDKVWEMSLRWSS
ncbi:hypothetical protein CkaCkLH20_12662 [Colletotrichum karsti]|uniref:2EXR domain-containing protein n=1 Tax=Colletotrichum karsti TaxID=1095194 RepID=A0A9P6LE17_9PEZI|nr:uncharacterized protein CkaCkLH20_12662 [Colletotrichum karsti]KAF9869863.1 hypothetical protein CkaCkLH20_12662 [Colletotrichum karsti]